MEPRAIDGRYDVVRVLGRGGQGTTFLAKSREDGREVALKEVELSTAGGWDSRVLFEREIGVLGGLTHPGIPRIIESFEVDGHPFLVQEFVPGVDLEQRVVTEQFDEARLRSIASQALDVLAYLHRYNPPVLHRDVKPANLVERDDGSVSVVDFGAAQGGAQIGEAVIGSTGYMPAEQLMGRAVPASDQFALGATLIRLATRRHPSELGDGLGFEWRGYANLTEPFADWIDRLVQPVAEDRFPSALAAQRALGDLDRQGAIERASADNTAMEFQTRWERYRVFRRGAKMTVYCPIPKEEANVVKLVVAVEVMFVAFFFGWVVALAVFVFMMIPSRDRALRLHGSPQGLDIVWQGQAEVVKRVRLDELAGFERRGPSLVVWTTTGEKIRFDWALLRWRDVRQLEDVLNAWLADARRMP